MATEQLTDEERAIVALIGAGGDGEVPDLLAMPVAKALRIIDAHAADRAALVAQLEAANGLLARAQDGSAKRPREANTDSVQLDYDIGKHLERNGWRWDAINRKWTQADTATWTEYRGRQP